MLRDLEPQRQTQLDASPLSLPTSIKMSAMTLTVARATTGGKVSAPLPPRAPHPVDRRDVLPSPPRVEIWVPRGYGKGPCRCSSPPPIWPRACEPPAVSAVIRELVYLAREECQSMWGKDADSFSCSSPYLLSPNIWFAFYLPVRLGAFSIASMRLRLPRGDSLARPPPSPAPGFGILTQSPPMISNLSFFSSPSSVFHSSDHQEGGQEVLPELLGLVWP